MASSGRARPLDGAQARAFGFTQARQAWTIARIELRRVFFARRGLWVYALALLPAIAFVGHGLDTKFQVQRLSRRGLADPALMTNVQKGEAFDTVKARLGTPAESHVWNGTRRVRQSGKSGTTTHVIEPAVDARFVRLNITRSTYNGEPGVRIYELEIYGPDNPGNPGSPGSPVNKETQQNLALGRPATGSQPCSPEQDPSKAVNGGVSGGPSGQFCARGWSGFLQVDLGTTRRVRRFVVKHASAGGESEDLDTRDFNIQVSNDARTFSTVVTSSGAALTDVRTEYRSLTYFDGRQVARLQFVDGKFDAQSVDTLLNFAEDRMIFAAMFRYFYLRLAVFFGCLGMFMYLFSGEMTSRTLHYWLLAPVRRDVLLAGKYAAGLLASSVIFAAGALIAFAALVWPQDAVDAQAYWNSGGLSDAFWYASAAALGCLGYGSVFLAIGVALKKPIIPAALLLVWESINGILPEALQKLSILYYLQSLCPGPVPLDHGVPAVIRLLAAPAVPASRPVAIFSVMVLAAAVLWFASRAVRRMEISYGTEG